MGTYAPQQLVVGAVRKPLPFGLFSVLEAVTPEEPYWEAGGVTWEYLVPSVGTLGQPNTEGLAEDLGLPKTFAEGSGDPSWNNESSAEPFSVYGHFKASPLAWDQERAERRALEHLLHGEESQVESMLWNGTRDNQPWLGEAFVDLGTTTALLAIGLLENHIATSYGSLGVLHMSRKHAANLLSLQALTTRNGQLLTHLGTPVVAGAGYGSTVIYGSPALFGFRSEVFTSSRKGSPLLDVTNNDMYAVAERTYLIGYDPTGVGSVTIS